MPVYMFQETYTSEAWAVQIKDPQNRMEVARKIIETQGGKLLSAYYAFGEHDVVLIADFPDNVSAAAIALTVSAGGAAKAFKTTVLMSVDEVLEAMRRAGRTAYPATGELKRVWLNRAPCLVDRLRTESRGPGLTTASS